jgi:hypothetical protein
MKPFSLKQALFVGLLSFAQFWIMTDQLNSPYRLLNEYDTQFIAEAVEVNRERGLSFTKGLTWHAPGSYANPTQSYRPYLHGPPLFTDAMTLVAAFFDNSAKTHRITLALCCIFLSVSFYLLCLRARMAFPWAEFAYLSLALSPMLLFFGRVVGIMVFTTCFSTLALLFISRPAPQATTRAGICGFFAQLSHHMPVVMALGMVAWATFRKDRREHLRASVGFLAGTLLGIAVWLGACFLAVGFSGTIEAFLEAILRRSSAQAEGALDVFTLSMWASRFVSWNAREFTPLVFVLGFLGLGITLIGKRKSKVAIDETFCVMLLAGILYLSLFRSASYVHRYLAFFILPPLAGLLRQP